MDASNKKVEYRVRPVTRYIITRYEEETYGSGGSVQGSESLGEFDNQDIASRVMNSLHVKELTEHGADKLISQEITNEGNGISMILDNSSKTTVRHTDMGHMSPDEAEEELNRINQDFLLKTRKGPRGE